MTGRKKKPNSVQIAAGDPRKLGKRKLQEKLESEPAASCGLPDCPDHLKGRARDTWHFWARELEVMQLDQRPDAHMLEGACVAYSQAVDADLEIQRTGITIKETYIADDGDVIILKIKKNPAVDISRAAWTQVRMFCTEFGFSPVSRARLAGAARQNKTETLADILSAPRPEREAEAVVQ